MAKYPWLTLPNVLSLSRIFMLPVLIWLAHSPWPLAFLVLYIIVGSTDFFDGRLARGFNQVTPVGKVFDSVADLAFYLGSAYFLYVMHTATITANATYLYIFFGLLILSLLVPALLFKKLLIMHTKLLKLNAVLVYFLMISSFFFNTIYFTRLILVLYCVGFVEEILIYSVYGEIDPDTPSIFSLGEIAD